MAHGFSNFIAATVTTFVIVLLPYGWAAERLSALVPYEYAVCIAFISFATLVWMLSKVHKVVEKQTLVVQRQRKDGLVTAAAATIVQYNASGANTTDGTATTADAKTKLTGGTVLSPPLQVSQVGGVVPGDSDAGEGGGDANGEKISKALPGTKSAGDEVEEEEDVKEKGGAGGEEDEEKEAEKEEIVTEMVVEADAVKGAGGAKGAGEANGEVGPAGPIGPVRLNYLQFLVIGGLLVHALSLLWFRANTIAIISLDRRELRRPIFPVGNELKSCVDLAQWNIYNVAMSPDTAKNPSDCITEDRETPVRIAPGQKSHIEWKNYKVIRMIEVLNHGTLLRAPWGEKLYSHVREAMQKDKHRMKNREEGVEQPHWMSIAQESLKSIFGIIDRSNGPIRVEAWLNATCEQMAASFLHFQKNNDEYLLPGYECEKDRKSYFREFARAWLFPYFKDLKDDLCNLYAVDVHEHQTIGVSLESSSRLLVVLDIGISIGRKGTSRAVYQPYRILEVPVSMKNQSDDDDMNCMIKYSDKTTFPGYSLRSYSEVVFVTHAVKDFRSSNISLLNVASIKRVQTEMSHLGIGKAYIVLTKCTCELMTEALLKNDIYADVDECSQDVAKRKKHVQNYANELMKISSFFEVPDVQLKFAAVDGHLNDVLHILNTTVDPLAGESITDTEIHAPVISPERRYEAAKAIQNTVNTPVANGRTNVVLLGVHGSGKTSFIKYLCHYSKGCSKATDAALVTNIVGSITETREYSPFNIGDCWRVFDTKGIPAQASLEDISNVLLDIIKGVQLAKPCEMHWRGYPQKNLFSWFSSPEPCAKPENGLAHLRPHAFAFFSTFQGRPSKDFTQAVKDLARQFSLGVIFVLGDLTGCNEKTATSCKKLFASEIGVGFREVVALQSSKLVADFVPEEDCNFAVNNWRQNLYIQAHDIKELVDKLDGKAQIYQQQPSFPLEIPDAPDQFLVYITLSSISKGDFEAERRDEFESKMGGIIDGAAVTTKIERHSRADSIIVEFYVRKSNGRLVPAIDVVRKFHNVAFDPKVFPFKFSEVNPEDDTVALENNGTTRPTLAEPTSWSIMDFVIAVFLFLFGALVITVLIAILISIYHGSRPIEIVKIFSATISNGWFTDSRTIMGTIAVRKG